MRPDSPPGRIAKWLQAAAALLLLLMMMVVFTDVVLRNVFNNPLPWGTELLELVLAGMIFLIYPVLASSHGHITVDLIPVPPWVQSVQRLLGALLGVLLFGLVSGCLVRQTIRAAEFDEKTAMLNLPIAWILGALAVFAAATCIAFLAAALRACEAKDARNSVQRELESL